MFESEGIFKAFIVCLSGIVLMLGFSSLLGFKRYKFQLAVSLIGIVTTVLAFSFSVLIKYAFILIFFLGFSGILKKLFSKKSFLMNICNLREKFKFSNPDTLNSVCAIIAICGAIALNLWHFPDILYGFVNEGIVWLQIGHDILFKSAISSEVLNTDVFARIHNPFYYPSQLAAHHIGAEGVAAFLELPFKNWNIINFTRVNWCLIVAGLSILLFENSRAVLSFMNCKNSESGFRKNYYAIASILLCLFFLSLIGSFGKDYSVIAYFNYNPESWWGAFFFLSAFFALINKNYKWSFYLLFCAACFKISLFPSAIAAGLFILVERKRFKPKFLLPALLPIATAAFIIILSLTDSTNSAVGASLKGKLFFNYEEVKSWTLAFYLTISEPFISIFPYHYKGLFLLLIQILFPVIVLSVCYIGSKFALKNFPEGLKDIYLKGLLFGICAAFPVLIFKTVSNVHFSIDPWMTGIWISLFITVFVMSVFISAAFLNFKKARGVSKTYRILSVTVILLITCFIRPDLMIVKRKYFKEKEKIAEIEGAVIKDNMYYASFWGKRIHRIADNPYGRAFSLKTKNK